MLLPRVPCEGLDLLGRLLQLRPGRRSTVKAVLDHPYLQPFVDEDSILRRRYAAASVGTAARFAPPIPDGVRLSPREYRAVLEGAGGAPPLAETLHASGEGEGEGGAPTGAVPAEVCLLAALSEADCAC